MACELRTCVREINLEFKEERMVVVHGEEWGEKGKEGWWSIDPRHGVVIPRWCKES